MWKLEEGKAVYANDETMFAGFFRYLEEMPKKERQLLGWFRNLVYDPSRESVVISHESDMIILPGEFCKNLV